MEAKRVAVFFDWQNVYKAARNAFDLNSLGNERGNIDPYNLARLLAAGNGRGKDGSELVHVEVHRGLPSSARDPIGYGANRRQAAAWQKGGAGVVVPRMRPLRYPHPSMQVQTPVEKGIDVQLALGAVECTVTEKCDVAIVFSHDSDLLPAIESIARLKSPNAVETVSWRSHTFKTRLKQVPGVHHHSLPWSIFQLVEDPVNYAHKEPR
jgi:hypothetical protein